MRIANVKRAFALTEIKSGELIEAWVSAKTLVARATIHVNSRHQETGHDCNEP